MKNLPLLKYTIVNQLSSPQFSTIFAGSSQSKHPYPVLDPQGSLNSLWDLIYIYTGRRCVLFCLGGCLRRLPKFAPTWVVGSAAPFVREASPPVRCPTYCVLACVLHPARWVCTNLPTCVLLPASLHIVNLGVLGMVNSLESKLNVSTYLHIQLAKLNTIYVSIYNTVSWVHRRKT